MIRPSVLSSTPSSTVALAPDGAPRVLVVDDEETIRLALAKFLRSRGYHVTTAESGSEALNTLADGEFLLMLCDVRMPGMSGVEVVRQATKNDPNLAAMMLTAVNDAPTATEALANGAMDYLMKPIELPDLLAACERALRKREILIEQRRVEQLIREEVAVRTAELEQEKERLRALTVSIAETLINAMEAKDIYLRGHSQRVAELAASVADQLGLDEDTIEAVRLAGRLHDVGKIGIREEVLNKPGRLTTDEFEHVKDHVRIGMEILAPLKHLGRVLDFIRDHHEHVDGRGYPRGASASEITIGGKILAACDAFDALTSKRAYREPMTSQETIDYLRENAIGKLLDPAIFDALCMVLRRRKSLVFIE
ncbi:MAG TPA: HD domain-containing phosphohydrolase [Gemmatimonadaceae bacterium]|nr:HD domain-containing phosphohydrolase [Gemmatimonadaceae bacterium]